MTNRIIVTPEKLAEHLVVWLRVAPLRHWRELEKQDEAERKSAGYDPLTRFDGRRAMAEFLAEKFAVSGWEITYEEPGPRRSPGSVHSST